MREGARARARAGKALMLSSRAQVRSLLKGSKEKVPQLDAAESKAKLPEGPPEEDSDPKPPFEREVPPSSLPLTPPPPPAPPACPSLQPSPPSVCALRCGTVSHALALPATGRRDRLGLQAREHEVALMEEAV